VGHLRCQCLTTERQTLSCILIPNIVVYLGTCFRAEKKYRVGGPEFKVLLVSMRHGGRAIAQAVSRWLPTAAARVRARVCSCGICGGQSGAGLGFLRVLRFPLPIFIPPISPQSPSSIIWGWYNRLLVAAVPSWLNLTPLTIIINIFFIWFVRLLALRPLLAYCASLGW
jgi:hypothetical protein